MWINSTELLKQRKNFNLGSCLIHSSFKESENIMKFSVHALAATLGSLVPKGSTLSLVNVKAKWSQDDEYAFGRFSLTLILLSFGFSFSFGLWKNT